MSDDSVLKSKRKKGYLVKKPVLTANMIYKDSMKRLHAINIRIWKTDQLVYHRIGPGIPLESAGGGGSVKSASTYENPYETYVAACIMWLR